MTYEISQGKWETKQFVATNLSSWESTGSWDDFGGGGTVKSVSLNGQTINPDAQGNVALTVEEVTVDESLDLTSTNPVENRAVAAALGQIEANTVANMEAELSQDESTVTLSLLNQNNSVIASVDIPAGSGGGGEGATTRIVLSASVSQSIIKEGGQCSLSYSYDHQNASGEDAGTTTGQKATIEIRIQRGSILVHTETLTEVSRGDYTMNLADYLQVGTTDIYVKATTTDPTTGNIQTKQAYTSVRVVNLSLTSSYSLANGVASGGYQASESVVVPYTVMGTGNKTVYLYLDGVQSQTASVTRSGTTNGSFNVSMSGLSVGRHTVQLVAEMQASELLTLTSESVYFDIYKAGSTAPIIGTKMIHKDGRIFDDTEHLTPVVAIGQYEQLSFEYCVYDADGVPATMDIRQAGAVVQTVNVPRAVQNYVNRFTEQGALTMKFECGASEYPFYIYVTESSIDVSEATLGLQLKLSAAGRSNGEANPAHWENNGIVTSFTNVDWNTSGWTGDALKLMNGASAVIGIMPFETDAATNGATIEVELRVTNIHDKTADVVSCMDGTKGFQITGEKAMMYTGSTKIVVDDDDQSSEQPVGVGRQYGSGMWVKCAFVIGQRADGRLMELYVNGVRCAADIYGSSDNFQQDNPRGITIGSAGAVVEVRNVRVYGRALSDDEEMDNYIVDRESLDSMAQLYEKNDVLDDSGSAGIDFHKLREQGKGLMLVTRQGGLAEVNATNNKKTDFLSDVDLYLPDGRHVAMKNVNIRIQGTSSTKYPTKNYRIYCAKSKTNNAEMYIDGVQQQTLKLPLRIGQKPVKILCAKADYSDSSMCQNTGGARLWNNMMKNLGYLTPPQQEDDSVRTAIDGYPIDVFSREDEQDSSPEYYGQYNLNHDKSDWQSIIGMEGVADYTPVEPIAYEFLNNTQPLCLFQANQDLDAQAAEQFDDALEFNYPADTTWATSTTAQKNAFKRLWGWIRDCVPSGATPTDISTFVSQDFKDEVSDYIDTDFLLAWWLFTDYFANVDQRAKNMIWATWDGLKWYILYYDGDTQLGDRNDSMLAYLYDVSRDTWDSEKSKYAFEGHDSWLWCLVLANFSSEIKAMATTMRTWLTKNTVNNVFDNEQQDNWCGRAYNKSGNIKYIIPQTEGVIVDGQIKTYSFIYALKGDKQAFRHWFIDNRFALLDAKYEAGDYMSDNIDMYISRSASDPNDTIIVTSNDLYYFGYGTNNSPHLQPSQQADKDETVTLAFMGSWTLNDPIRIYGASRMAALDMRGIADHLSGQLSLNKCNVLRSLDLSTSGTGSTGWSLELSECLQLVNVNLYGQPNAKTGTPTSVPELDFSHQTRLASLDARGVNVQAVLFAKGSPLATAKLGSSIQTLRLEYLPDLTMEGLSLQDWTTVKALRFAGCPQLDWQTLASRCTALERIRIEGVDIEDDGTILNRYKTLKGLDADGNAVDYCAITGMVRLTSYMEEDDYAEIRSHYPELTILQPEYSVLEFDDSIQDDANVSNLDNKTGYKFGNDYEPSGHVKLILNRRHRVLAKLTKMPTTRSIVMAAGTSAEGSFAQNKPDGEMTIFPLHDENSNYYADADDIRNCTPASLDGTQGDWMMYEPHRWIKGVNDYLHDKHYACWSSNEQRPSSPSCTVITLDEIQATANAYTDNKKLKSGFGTLAASLVTDSSYAVCRVDVSGYAKVRFPSVIGTGSIGAAFTDAENNVLSTIVVSTLTPSFVDGMYIIADVPVMATAINFTIQKQAQFDKVVLSNSTRIEDMEPDWVEVEPYLCAIVGSSVVGNKLRACITGGTTLASQTWEDFHDYSQQRGMQQIDGLMHNDIANLFFAKYGRRNSQMQCGAGSNSNSRTTGGTAVIGMLDTVNSNGTTDGGYEGSGKAYYRSIDGNGEVVYISINNINCLGYEDIYGHKYDMMDCVEVPNSSNHSADWHYFMPDGTERWVKGSSVTGYIKSVANGLFMDVVPVGCQGASSSYFYCDNYSYNSGAGRVVYRGNNIASANGGVSCAYANHVRSNSYTYFGSRLAFRGKIVKAASVATFEATLAEA